MVFKDAPVILLQNYVEGFCGWNVCVRTLRTDS